MSDAPSMDFYMLEYALQKVRESLAADATMMWPEGPCRQAYISGVEDALRRLRGYGPPQPLQTR